MNARVRAAWPPPCDGPKCSEPTARVFPKGVTVDFGTGGKQTLMRLCEGHARTWAARR